MTQFVRRAATIALATLVFGSAPGRAQERFPSHTVKLFVPAAGGSTTDTLARIVAEQLGRTWGKPVVVENVSGGGMVVGATQAYRAAPDGYTLMVSPPSPITLTHLLYRDLAYDPLQFVPVALLARVANALVVRHDLPAADVGELVAYARSNPGKLTYGSQGAGSTAHLSASQLEIQGGIKMVHVPYRGAVPALNDVIAGHIDMFFDTLTTSVPMYRGGKVRILAVGSTERSAVVPEVPTFAESGFPGFRSVTWFAIVAPPATPAALADKINRDVVASLARPQVARSLAALTLEPMPGSPADAAMFFAEETRLWGKVIAAAHIKVE
ncbi:MAG TPA: tripartite tricarboxylate transporter substrate binding protein [Xanthobacteraceae bacterium]|nr:tripartite tricarboxylate transporter substrate binding protein [Xanthobacteraceae bacterium]